MKERKTERERKTTEVGGTRGREKARCFYTPESKNPDLKQSQKDETKAVHWFNKYWRCTTIHPDESCGSKTTSQNTSLTLRQSCISKQRTGSRMSIYICNGSYYCSTYFVLCVEYSRAAVCAELQPR